MERIGRIVYGKIHCRLPADWGGDAADDLVSGNAAGGGASRLAGLLVRLQSALNQARTGYTIPGRPGKAW